MPVVRLSRRTAAAPDALLGALRATSGGAG